MKKGFTMIELIFVIVILGILAAVALPRMIGVQEQAKEGVAKAFVGTLNRTVGPSLWSKAIMDGNASIESLTGDDANLSIYTELPSGMEVDADFTDCVASTALVTPSIAKGTTSSYFGLDSSTGIYLVCRDSNDTSSPKFWYTDTTGTALTLDDNELKLK